MSFRFHKIVPRRRRTSYSMMLVHFSSASCRRQTNRFIAVVVLLSITTLAPLWRFSRTLPVTITTRESSPSHYHHKRVETIFLEGTPFSAKVPRTLYRQVPEFTDVTQTYDYTDSTDHEGTMELRIFPIHENDDMCVPMAPEWQSTFYPTCNEFHAYDAAEALKQQDLWLLSKKGYWRYAWEVVEGNEKKWTDKKMYRHDSSLVLRTFKLEHDYEEQYYENNRVDAIAMERLTKSPYVIDMYGFCGMSVVTEFAGQQISQVVDKKKPLEKLEMAKMIAQGVADVHGIDGEDQVTLVHNDLNFANILIGKNHSRPMINDFNIAVLMMKRNDTGESCPFTSHYPNPQWRAPEEQVDESTGKTSKLMTEKIDIYALGNVMYRFAVGRSPWKKTSGRSLTPEEKLEIARLKMLNGTLPYVPDEVRQSLDPATKSLLKIMRECYRHQPKLRPTATEVVDMLQVAIDEYKEMEAAARQRYLKRKADEDAEDKPTKDRKLKRDGKKKKKRRLGNASATR